MFLVLPWHEPSPLPIIQVSIFRNRVELLITHHYLMTNTSSLDLCHLYFILSDLKCYESCYLKL